MTISSARSYEFNIGQIVRQGYLDAGLLNVNQVPGAAQTQAGIDHLQRISASSAVFGFIARETDFYTLTLQATVSDYSLPEYVVDVIGSAMYLDPQQAAQGLSQAETQVNAILRDRWQQITSKSSTDAIPSYYFVNRAEVPVQVKIWPVPGTAQDTGTIRFQVQKLRADARSSVATPDFERFWVDFLVYELAARLAIANSLSSDRITALQGKADRALKEAKAFGRQHGRQQFKIGYHNPWRGR